MAKKKKRRIKKKTSHTPIEAKKDIQESPQIQKKSSSGKKKRAFFLIPAAGILLLLILLFVLPGKKEKKDRVRPNSDLNVLLITLDTMRGDRVGYMGYDIETPSMDALAQGGVSFRNAVCQVPLTLPSHASILTGTSPLFHKIRNNEDFTMQEDLVTLAEVLRERGYATSAFVSAFVLSSLFGTSQGFDVYNDKYDTPEALQTYGPQRIAEQTTEAALSWIKENREKKFFTWIHFFDPHFPYTPPPPFDEKYRGRPYDGEIAYMDVSIGEIVGSLKDMGLIERTLIIITGDHGEDLWQHSEPTHGIFLYDTALNVPLIFHCPGIIPAGISVEKMVRVMDIFPTVLNILQAPVPPGNQGQNLAQVMEGRDVKGLESAYAETFYPLFAHGWSFMECVRTDEWKFVRSVKPELYNLKEDPGETINLINAEPDTAARLEKEMELIKTETASSRSLPIKELDDKEREKLRSLGYLGTVVSPTDESSDRPDPKDMIDTLKKIYAARTAVRHGALETAETLFLDIKKEDPRNPRVYQALGKIYQGRKEWDRAITEFKEAVNLNPGDIVSHFQLSQCYYESGQIEKALEMAYATLDLRPNHLLTLRFLAFYHRTKGDIPRALEYLERALESDPGNTNIRLDYADALFLTQDFSRAIEELQKLLPLIPENPQLFNKLGRVYFYIDDFENAVRYLEKEVSLEGNAESYFLLGAAYGKMERFPEAVKHLDSFLRSASPQDPRRQRAAGALDYYKSRIK